MSLVSMSCWCYGFDYRTVNVYSSSYLLEVISYSEQVSFGAVMPVSNDFTNIFYELIDLKSELGFIFNFFTRNKFCYFTLDFLKLIKK